MGDNQFSGSFGLSVICDGRFDGQLQWLHIQVALQDHTKSMETVSKYR